MNFWITTIIVLGNQEWHLYKTANVIDKFCVCSEHTTNWKDPQQALPASLSLSFDLPIR